MSTAGSDLTDMMCHNVTDTATMSVNEEDVTSQVLMDLYRTLTAFPC